MLTWWNMSSRLVYNTSQPRQQSLTRKLQRMKMLRMILVMWWGTQNLNGDFEFPWISHQFWESQETFAWDSAIMPTIFLLLVEMSEDNSEQSAITLEVQAVATETALIFTSLLALQEMVLLKMLLSGYWHPKETRDSCAVEKDIEPNMGPTHVWPGTNTVEHHATLWGRALSQTAKSGCFAVCQTVATCNLKWTWYDLIHKVIFIWL